VIEITVPESNNILNGRTFRGTKGAVTVTSTVFYNHFTQDFSQTEERQIAELKHRVEQLS
jgi:hypothetical protein